MLGSFFFIMVEVVEVVNVVGILCDCFLDMFSVCIFEDLKRFIVIFKRLLSC